MIRKSVDYYKKKSNVRAPVRTKAARTYSRTYDTFKDFQSSSFCDRLAVNRLKLHPSRREKGKERNGMEGRNGGRG